MSDDFNVMVRDGPGRRDEQVSVGELRLRDELTEQEQELLGALYEHEDDVLTYEDVDTAAPSYRQGGPSPTVPYPRPQGTRVSDAELQGRVGSLVSKGVLRAEQYTADEIDALAELNEEHDGMIRPDELEDEAYADVLSRQGAVYVRSTAAKSVDAGTESGRSLFTLTEKGREYGEFLAE